MKPLPLFPISDKEKEIKDQERQVQIKKQTKLDSLDQLEWISNMEKDLDQLHSHIGDLSIKADKIRDVGGRNDLTKTFSHVWTLLGKLKTQRKRELERLDKAREEYSKAVAVLNGLNKELKALKKEEESRKLKGGDQDG